MKKTINGIRYDTDIAHLVGRTWTKGYSSNSPTFWTARLYKTPRSENYFLHGYGGFMTIFKDSKKIIPLSHDQARAWVENFVWKRG